MADGCNKIVVDSRQLLHVKDVRDGTKWGGSWPKPDWRQIREEKILEMEENREEIHNFFTWNVSIQLKVIS
jgi:hypothetical protein